MRAVLCKNVPAVRDFRDVICPAAWKNPGSVCEHVVPFPVFPEFFSDFLPFGGGILVGISQLGEGKMVAGFIFSVFRLVQNWPFSGNSCPSVGKKWSFSRNFCLSVVSSRRERFFRRFFSCAQPYVPHIFLTCACFFLFVCTCARMCAYTRLREIHNVGLFPSVFGSIKKRSPATILFTAVYKKTFKISAKKYCVKVAETEKVRTFATAFERESR